MWDVRLVSRRAVSSDAVRAARMLLQLLLPVDALLLAVLDELRVLLIGCATEELIPFTPGASAETGTLHLPSKSSRDSMPSETAARYLFQRPASSADCSESRRSIQRVCRGSSSLGM